MRDLNKSETVISHREERKWPGAEIFFQNYVARKSVSLSGVDWQMVVSTLDESAANCFRCKNKGCDVCNMTRQIARNIEKQVNPGPAQTTEGAER